MAFLVKEDVTLNPLDISLFSAQAQMSHTTNGADFVEQPWLWVQWIAGWEHDLGAPEWLGRSELISPTRNCDNGVLGPTKVGSRQMCAQDARDPQPGWLRSTEVLG